MHKFIVRKLVFMAINALYIRCKFPTGQYLYFLYTCYMSKVMSKNVKHYLISCPTLVLRLNILSEKTITVRQCFSPHVRL